MPAANTRFCYGTLMAAMAALAPLGCGDPGNPADTPDKTTTCSSTATDPQFDSSYVDQLAAPPQSGEGNPSSEEDVASTSEAIVNGTNTNSYPEIGVVAKDDTQPTSRLCTGTLISRYAVLTSAHCVVKAPATSLSAFVFYTLKKDGSVDKQSEQGWATIDPDYKVGNPTLANDVAIIHLPSTWDHLPTAFDGVTPVTIRPEFRVCCDSTSVTSFGVGSGKLSYSVQKIGGSTTNVFALQTDSALEHGDSGGPSLYYPYGYRPFGYEVVSVHVAVNKLKGEAYDAKITTPMVEWIKKSLNDDIFPPECWDGDETAYSEESKATIDTSWRLKACFG